MFTNGILEQNKSEELFELASNFDALDGRDFAHLMDLCLGGALKS
jgi:hypothetical protein